MAALSTIAAIGAIGAAGASLFGKRKQQYPGAPIAPPPMPTAADTAPDAQLIAAQRLQARRRAAAASTIPPTLLTGWQGIQQAAPVQRKSLLGS